MSELFEKHRYEAAVRERARIESAAHTGRTGTVTRDVERLRGRHRAGRLLVTEFYTIEEAALIAGMTETEIRTALGRDEARGMFEVRDGHLRTTYRGELSSHISARELTCLISGPAAMRALSEER
jgi:hypothetical protein